tara:strand:+ start:1548 stop:1997 length:450 start_codon:yes stop_codon:yes gene_type:complete
MKKLKEYIRKELKSLIKEETVKRPLPDDAKDALFNLLNLRKTHINGIQAVKSIKPTYRIYLNNDQSFTLTDLGNNFGFGLVNINGKEYDILDRTQHQLALDALEKLQTKAIINPLGGEEGGGDEGDIEDVGAAPDEEPEETPEEEPEEA